VNRIEVEKAIRDLGGSVDPVRRKGENRYSHPLMSKRLTVSAHRKDATWAAELWLQRLAAKVEARARTSEVAA